MGDVDKWSWFDAVYAEERFTGAEKAVLGWLAAKAVFTGRDTFRIRQSTVAARTGEGERTVQRAYKRARELGYLTVVGQRQRGLYGKADEYRLMVPVQTQEVPDNLAGTSVVVPDRNDGSTRQDRTEYPTETTEVPDRADAVACEDAAPISSLDKFSRKVFRESVCVDDEPLDVEAVPDPRNALSPCSSSTGHKEQDESLLTTTVSDVIDAELVVDVPDPEPNYYCAAHMPCGTGERCPDCKISRKHWEAWKARQDARVLEAILSAPKPSPTPPKPTCSWCRDTGVVLNSDGAPGSTPRTCHHNGRFAPMTESELTQHADALDRLAKGA